jgi:1-deoxy-D-xylulose-5-phosphate reductoisomerase
MRKRIVLLGATGSIGSSTIEVVKHHKDKLQIVLATAHKNFEKLQSLIDELDTPYLGVTDNSIPSAEERKCIGKEVVCGEYEVLSLLQSLDYDILLNAVVGSAGLKYTVKAIETGHSVALANKESLVMGGEIIMQMAREKECQIIPVDSEHSAIFQCLHGDIPHPYVKKLILTASGGPFRTWAMKDFDKITPSYALNHPTWNMGKKISIDSATMVNKGLEVIEAHHLFGIPYQNIEIVIHPQSIIHSMVEFIDGAILAQLSSPDMKLPIQYALSYPERLPATAKATDITSLPDLTFEKMDYEKFPLLKLAFEVGERGGILPTIFSAANEAAVSLFLSGRIKFNDIYKIIKSSIERENILNPDLDTIFKVDKEIKEKIFARYG